MEAIDATKDTVIVNLANACLTRSKCLTVPRSEDDIADGSRLFTGRWIQMPCAAVCRSLCTYSAYRRHEPPFV